MTWLLLLLAAAFNAPSPSSRPTAPAPPTGLGGIGAEGSAELAPEFARAADRWSAAARQASAKYIEIGRDASTKDDDKSRLKSLIDAEVAKETGPLWLVLIGHGTFDGRDAKFNLRGPDVSDQELAAWLKPCRRPLAVIDCSSSSAPFLNKLSGQGRVVITATQSGNEIHFARFGDQMSAAIADPAADLDKDGQTSLLEAYLAASHRVDEFYKQAGRLATEHALLDDNGDARGTPASFFQGIRATRAAKDGAPVDGPRAHQWHLVMSATEQAMPPELRARRDALELKIEALRAKKSTLAEPDYYAQLDAILLELAHLYASPPAPTRP
jgi:hypothetical protein